MKDEIYYLLKFEISHIKRLGGFINALQAFLKQHGSCHWWVSPNVNDGGTEFGITMSVAIFSEPIANLALLYLYHLADNVTMTEESEDVRYRR